MIAVHIDALTGERGTQQFLALRAAHKFLIVVANYMPARDTDTLERTGDICGQFPIRVIILVADTIAKVDDHIGAPFVREVDELVQQRQG